MTDPAAAALPRRPPAGRPVRRDRDAARSAARRRRGPSPVHVVAGTLAVFLACLAFLAWQVRTGHDPSLGTPAAAAPARVLVKRVERKVVVTDVLPVEEDDAPTGGTASGGSVQVVQSSPAPAAPAPTTRSS